MERNSLPPVRPSPIRRLSPAVAQRIAAGEVIDRPDSVVRELLDNAIDSGARTISVVIENGGLDRIRVVDDGAGMSREDLAICTARHATSKITHDDDLLKLSTLGFRGEALAGIAASADVRITSRRGEEAAATVHVAFGSEPTVEAAAGAPGTTVDVANLFHRLPARKRFLKRPAAEAARVRSVVVERALAYPEITFHYLHGNGVPTAFVAADPIDRVYAVYADKLNGVALAPLSRTESDHTLFVLASPPNLARRDRSYLQVFVNRRRIREYALMQAVERAYAHALHGGLHPIAFVFLTVDPASVDFNVHPAKREVRFRDLPAIHHTISTTIGGFVSRHKQIISPAASALPWVGDADDAAGVDDAGRGADHAPPSPPPSRGEWGRGSTGYPNVRLTHSVAGERSGSGYRGTQAVGASSYRQPIQTGAGTSRRPAEDRAAPWRSPAEREHQDGSSTIRYLGRVFGVYLVAETGDSLYLVDMHAAHERLNYDRLRLRGGRQPLLVPMEFEVEPEQRAVVERNRKTLDRLGVSVEPTDDPDRWRLTAVPESFSGAEAALIDTVRELDVPPEVVEEQLYARTACRASIMDGDYIDPVRAHELLVRTFALEDARCPHGRPLWHAVSLREIERAIGRR